MGGSLQGQRFCPRFLPIPTQHYIKEHQSLARAVGLTVSYTARASRLQVDVALGPAGADHDPSPGGITVRDRRGKTEALGQGMQSAEQGRGQRSQVALAS